DYTNYNGFTVEIMDAKNKMYLDLSSDTKDGIQGNVYAEYAEGWIGGEVNWFIPEGATFNEKALDDLNIKFPAARLHVWIDVPGPDFVNTYAVGGGTPIREGATYNFSETRGFVLRSTLDMEATEELQLEEEGYSPAEAEAI